MPDTYSRPPTTPCPVRLRLIDGSTVEGVLWLLPDSARPSGVTSVETILDGKREFIAVGLDRGSSVLVNRSAIRTVEVAANGPGAADVDEGASLDVVTLRLDSGEEVSGVLRAVARAGAERMSDVFNASGRFISLGAGDRVVLAARDRIVRVTF
jgi:hypothetical protein